MKQGSWQVMTHECPVLWFLSPAFKAQMVTVILKLQKYDFSQVMSQCPPPSFISSLCLKVLIEMIRKVFNEVVDQVTCQCPNMAIRRH